MRLKNKEVRIENSSVCQAHCTYCPREKLTRSRVAMSNKHFFDLVNQSKDLGADTISIFGYGEPLTDSGITMKAAYAKDCNLQTFITTNGAFLSTGRSFSLLRAGLDHLRVSVHDIEKEGYEQIHRGLNFEKVIKNIHDFRDVRDYTGAMCRLTITCIPPAERKVSDILEYWEGIADNLEIWKPHNFAYGRAYRKGIVKKKTCGRPFNGPVQINADGQMMVCCFDFDGKMTIGDTATHSIEQLLKGDEIESIREKHRTGNLSGLPCSQCDQLYDGQLPLIYSTIDNETSKTFANKTRLGEI